jgi:hypothetical protein
MAYTNIDDPSAYFYTLIFTGGGTFNDQHINDAHSGDFQPDLIWAKDRVNAYNHDLVDSSRGPTVAFHPNTTDAEYTRTQSNYDFTSFDSNGFTAGGPDFTNSFGGNTNPNGKVAWQWKANGGTTSSNTAGGTTTTVQANQDAGFSIVTWTGNGATTTLGHGLGVEPEVIIQKARGTTSNWAVYHKDAGPAVSQASYNVVTYLNLTDVTGIASNSWGTAPSDINSNTFYLKYWFNYNTTNVAYCFASKQGYSKFGSYVGNGSTNGTFVYTGFKPAFIMLKSSSTAGNWNIYDASREGFNVNNNALYADANNAEDLGSTYAFMDIVSNGFKLRRATYDPNKVATYIYMAFAENPFTTSTGIPTTAR